MALTFAPADITPLVIASLSEHPHDDTPRSIAALLAGPSADAVFAVLEALRADGLVMEADGHWQLTSRGWQFAH